MLKSAILFHNDTYMNMFETAYRAIMRHVRSANGFFYLPTNMYHLNPMVNNVDALGAFFPGLQVQS